MRKLLGKEPRILIQQNGIHIKGNWKPSRATRKSYSLLKQKCFVNISALRNSGGDTAKDDCQLFQRAALLSGPPKSTATGPRAQRHKPKDPQDSRQEK